MTIQNISIRILLFMAMMNLIILSVYASEVQMFRDELAKEQSESKLSYKEYQTELDKLLNPKPLPQFQLKYILFPLGVIAIGIVLIFFIKQIRMNIISEVHDKETEIVGELVTTEKAALAHADTAENANDFRDALRYLYLSAILNLQERGILPYDKSMTNREYLHQAHLDINLQQTFGTVVTVFDDVWYGHKTCDADTIANYRDLLQKI